MEKVRRNRAPRVGPLRTPGELLTEGGRVYRKMRHGEIETVEGCRLIAALGDLRKSSELAIVEERLRAIEERVTIR
jgi:hypothetical protein